MNNQNNKNQQNGGGNFFNKNPIGMFVVFALILIVIFRAISPNGGGFGEGATLGNLGVGQTRNVSYSELKSQLKTAQISMVSIGKTTIKAQSGDIMYVAQRVDDNELVSILESRNIPYGAYNETNLLTDLLFSWVLPLVIFFGIWMFLANRMQKNMGSGMLGIGSSKNLMSAEKPNVKFSDVAGVEEAKEEVKEIVDFLKNPERYISLGAKIPKGVLLVGPPGTGKTLLAKAVAGEADVPFFSISASSFIEMFVGVGASRVRDLFETAKKQAPAIVFIDEIDAIGKSRNSGGIGGGNDEREQTLNQLLAEMDGFGTESSPVIVLAATNRPETLDAALLRPGRFDRQVLVDRPDYDGRIAILKVHMRDVKFARDIDIEEIARLTVGFAGADLANIINEAALLAGREAKKEVEQKDLLEAIERVAIGLEKKSRRVNPVEKKIVAYHESGHALIAELTKGAMPVSKVTIVPRGLGAAGYTLNSPFENRFLHQRYEIFAEIDVLLSGRAAEEVFLGEITDGASNDLQRATDWLKFMAAKVGMTDELGLIVLEKQQYSFLNGGQSIKDYSEETAVKIDNYVRKTLDERYKAVKDTLKTYSGAIEEMVKTLYEKETVAGEVIVDIIDKFEKENNLPTRLVRNLAKENPEEEA
ncbi:ATP-dependent zinc metalloprotease FtsH [Campylobacter sp. JMF_08 NE1]|uniref:ATP-dependent zinc metalloprotease FtsH n=1 Tax=Campylobacter sp. JMF_08 NE1 TaxID=2983821 RepID=UPI0022E99E93|nr:ATP-dependent zinc metalloprotease FtsH [Campylobacter sp. JMF_08 NE1]MDA3048362.1 ATP-dependent zinc metalloprotease FtsH [Campylobacter sp. JMF_08 NE1]